MAAKDFQTLLAQDIQSSEHTMAKKLQERLGTETAKIQTLDIVPNNGNMGYADTVVLTAEKGFSRDNLTKLGLEEIPNTHSSGGRRDHHGHYVTETTDDHTKNIFLIKAQPLAEKLGVSLSSGMAKAQG